jgi:TRAP-type C4-dicarboxylate transport system permease small subunit
MVEKAASLFERLDTAGRFVENLLLVGLLGGMMLLSVAQIVAREVFETGFYWSGELIKIMVLWLAMVGAVAACREDRHIRIDAISHLLSDRAISIVRLLVDTFAAGVCGVIAWHAWRYVQLEMEWEETVLIDTPAWIIHLIMPVAFALLSYRFLVGVGKGAVTLALGEEAEAVE